MLRNKYTVNILWLPIFVCVHKKVWRLPAGWCGDRGAGGMVWSWAVCRFAGASPIFFFLKCLVCACFMWPCLPYTCSRARHQPFARASLPFCLIPLTLSALAPSPHLFYATTALVFILRHGACVHTLAPL